MCSTSTSPLAFMVCPGRHQIDDAPAQSQLRRQFHRAVELDAFRLHAARREMPRRDLGILGRDADVAPARPGRRFGHQLLGFGDHQPAFADAEVERRVDLRIVELHQDVVAGDPDLRGAEGDESGDVEAAHPDDAEPRILVANCSWRESVSSSKGASGSMPARRTAGMTSPRIRPFGRASTRGALAGTSGLLTTALSAPALASRSGPRRHGSHALDGISGPQPATSATS